MKKFYTTIPRPNSQPRELLTKYSNILVASSILTGLVFALFGNVNAMQPPKGKGIIVIEGGIALREIAALPSYIKEASGLEITQGRHLWTHNDDRLPILYCLDTLGKPVRTLQLNHPNHGWEDLTQDELGNLYVGATGNNKNDKRSLSIYKIPAPDAIAEKVITASIIKFTYSDQTAFPPPPSKKNFDSDAFIARGDSLYLFTKNRTAPFTGFTKIYRLPNTPGDHSAVAVDSIFLGSGPMMDSWVTAADISPDGKTLVLLSHQHLWIIRDFAGNKFSSGQLYKINLDHFSHKAGISFYTNSFLYIVDELELGLIGGKLYSLDLSKLQLNPQ